MQTRALVLSLFLKPWCTCVAVPCHLAGLLARCAPHAPKLHRHHHSPGGNAAALVTAGASSGRCWPRLRWRHSSTWSSARAWRCAKGSSLTHDGLARMLAPVLVCVLEVGYGWGAPSVLVSATHGQQLTDE